MPALIDIRTLTVTDLPAAWELGRLAFGSNPEPPATALTPNPTAPRHGAFNPDGHLVGMAVDLHHDQWWGGRKVSAADIAGVAVAPEARGRGVARALLTAVLRGARERGAAISTLFPTVCAPYRKWGWEVCGSQRQYRINTADLPASTPDPTLTVRAGTPGDLPAIHALYTTVAAHRCGWLTRDTGLYFPEPGALPRHVDGMTLVERGGQLVGFALWERGRGYGDTAALTITDIQAADAAAARELLTILAGWRSVTPTIRLTPAAGDAVSMALPVSAMRTDQERPWMHRPVDVVRAVADRGWPEHAAGTVAFELVDGLAPWNNGQWRLEIAHGRGQLTAATGTAGLRLSVRGFAALYAGAATAAELIEAGLLEALDQSQVSALDLLGSGPAAQQPDYF